MDQIVSLWQAGGISHPLSNPYQRLTKGEMLMRCRNQELLRRLFPLTISCARPEVGRWQGEASGACGYCYPCLMRRAALHRLGWDDAKDYRVDVLSETKIMRHRVRGSDLRALFFALKTWEEAPGELEARLLLASPTADLAERRSAALPLLDRGFQEIAAFIREKGGEGWAVFLVNV